MSPAWILRVYVLFAVAELLWESLLILLNMSHARVHATEIPPFFRELWGRGRTEPPEETQARSVRYTLARGRLALAANGFSSALAIAILASGSLGLLDRKLAGAIPSETAASLLFVLSVALALRLGGLPFGLYARFVLERRFGFNTTTLWLWVRDLAKGLLLSLFLLVPLILGLFWFMDRAGAWWWLYAASALVLLQIALTVLHPALIAPLFNKFVPLPEGSLRERVLELARRLRFGVRGIFVMDASRRSRHSNAYFTGIGRSKRIVFYDTLLKKVGEEETLGVLAHEIGHEKLGHVRAGLLLSAVASVGALWVLSLLVRWDGFFLAFGLGGRSSQAALVIFLLCSGPVGSLFQPVLSLWSRRHEEAADRYAHRAMGSSAPLLSALLALHADNLSNLHPHPLYSFTHYSHPSLAERVAALERLDRSREPSGGARSPA